MGCIWLKYINKKYAILILSYMQNQVEIDLYVLKGLRNYSTKSTLSCTWVLNSIPSRDAFCLCRAHVGVTCMWWIWPASRQFDTPGLTDEWEDNRVLWHLDKECYNFQRFTKELIKTNVLGLKCQRTL